MDTLTLSAYAKINLTLTITGKREDGYHTLESVMQEISLADTLLMKKIPQGIVISCDRDTIPTDERNLCHKAARRYLELCGIDGGVHITLQKRIPDGAGMGGGSSDAASVLRGMAALYPSEIDLARIAATIGADVPFFLSGKTTFCEGIGEIMTPLPFLGKERVWCVVVKNDVSLSTPKMYALFDESKPENRRVPDAKAIRDALAHGDLTSFYPLMHNDLELAAVTLCPEITQMKGALLSLGADAAMMTGSGSAVFGLFGEERAARRAAEQLKTVYRESHFCTLL